MLVFCWLRSFLLCLSCYSTILFQWQYVNASLFVCQCVMSLHYHKWYLSYNISVVVKKLLVINKIYMQPLSTKIRISVMRNYVVKAARVSVKTCNLGFWRRDVEWGPLKELLYLVVDWLVCAVAPLWLEVEYHIAHHTAAGHQASGVSHAACLCLLWCGYGGWPSGGQECSHSPCRPSLCTGSTSATSCCTASGIWHNEISIWPKQEKMVIEKWICDKFAKLLPVQGQHSL